MAMAGNALPRISRGGGFSRGRATAAPQQGPRGGGSRRVLPSGGGGFRARADPVGEFLRRRPSEFLRRRPLGAPAQMTPGAVLLQAVLSCSKIYMEAYTISSSSALTWRRSPNMKVYERRSRWPSREIAEVHVNSMAPMRASTSSCLLKVRKDISTSLVLRNPHIVVGSFDRRNLFYGVKSCNRSISFISELVKDVSKRSAVGESTIIYCTTIRETEQHEQMDDTSASDYKKGKHPRDTLGKIELQ